MPYEVDRYKIACALILFAVSAIIIISAYHVSGVGWDFLSQYLNGRTLTSGYFYAHLGVFGNKVPVNVSVLGINRTFNFAPALTVSKNIYFDEVWTPLPAFLMGLFAVALNANALCAYLIFLLLLLFVSSFITAKKLDVDPLILSSLMIGPFVILVTILYNGAEILALSLALLSIGYAVQKQYKAGLWASLAGLAKYDALIMVPIIFLLGDRKNVAKAIALAVLVAIPWLAFNFVLFGSPIQSYWTQIAEAQPQPAGIAVFVSLFASIVWYPLALFLIAAACLAYFNRKRLKVIKPLKLLKSSLKDQKTRVVVSSLILTVLGFAVVYKSAQGSIRLGYLVYLAFAVIASLALSRLAATKTSQGRGKAGAGWRLVPYAVFAVSLVLLFSIHLGNGTGMTFNANSLNSRDAVFSDAANALQSDGLGNCSVVSNAWPYMNFYNVTTYSPYLCNATIERMPVVVFSSIGVSDYCTGSVHDLKGISRQFDYPNFSIYVSENYACAR